METSFSRQVRISKDQLVQSELADLITYTRGSYYKLDSIEEFDDHHMITFSEGRSRLYENKDVNKWLTIITGGIRVAHEIVLNPYEFKDVLTFIEREVPYIHEYIKDNKLSDITIYSELTAHSDIDLVNLVDKFGHRSDILNNHKDKLGHLVLVNIMRQFYQGDNFEPESKLVAGKSTFHHVERLIAGNIDFEGLIEYYSSKIRGKNIYITNQTTLAYESTHGSYFDYDGNRIYTGKRFKNFFRYAPEFGILETLNLIY
jgi:hypothetical protein